ncbi:MAG: hypothetical protein AABZ67_05760 [Pseudomonadota bacterium]
MTTKVCMTAGGMVAENSANGLLVNIITSYLEYTALRGLESRGLQRHCHAADARACDENGFRYRKTKITPIFLLPAVILMARAAAIAKKILCAHKKLGCVLSRGRQL